MNDGVSNSDTAAESLFTTNEGYEYAYVDLKRERALETIKLYNTQRGGSQNQADRLVDVWLLLSIDELVRLPYFVDVFVLPSFHLPLAPLCLCRSLQFCSRQFINYHCLDSQPDVYTSGNMTALLTKTVYDTQITQSQVDTAYTNDAAITFNLDPGMFLLNKQTFTMQMTPALQINLDVRICIWQPSFVS